MSIPIKISLPITCLLLNQSSLAELLPNGDFEDGASSWLEVAEGGSFAFSYPATGGNPAAFGIIDHSEADGGFGIWVGNGGAALSLSELGLTAGNTYNFTQDMMILSGSSIGGFKIDFTNAGENSGLSTGDLYPQLIGDGSSWETYTFPIEIPAEVDGLKIVPLWGPNSSIAYDNFCFDPNPLESPLNPPTEPPVDPPTPPSTAAQLSEGTLISWQPDQAERIYQPQSSQDGSTWTDLGPAFPGTETTSILDPNSAPFHRVQEREPLGEQFIINGDFENADPNNPSCPRNWSCLSTSGQFPRRVEGRAFSGSASVSIAVQNDEGGAPNQSEIQQNLLAAGGFIIGGDTYTFSFRAMQLSAGESYVQMYRLQWLDINGAPINGADVGFNSFEGGNGFWNEIIEPSLVAPPSANGVFIQIFGATGVSSNLEARGEVLIDAIRLTPGSPSTPINLATTSEPGIGITQLTRIGVRYRAQQSEDLDHFTDLSGTFTGNGQIMGAGIPDGGPSHFFRLLEVSEEDDPAR